VKLIAILNLLLMIALGWSWHAQLNSAIELQNAQGKLDACSKHAVELARNQNSELKNGLAAPGYDCSREISELLRKQNLESHQAIRVTPPTDINGRFAFQGIENPIKEQATLKQIIGFLLQADSAPVRYSTSFISLQAPPTRRTNAEPELWEVVDLKLRYVANNNTTE